jgi:hypothetical protein
MQLIEFCRANVAEYRCRTASLLGLELGDVSVFHLSRFLRQERIRSPDIRRPLVSYDPLLGNMPWSAAGVRGIYAMQENVFPSEGERTLCHELGHVALYRLAGACSVDAFYETARTRELAPWLTEGFPEYVSLQMTGSHGRYYQRDLDEFTAFCEEKALRSSQAVVDELRLMLR